MLEIKAFSAEDNVKCLECGETIIGEGSIVYGWLMHGVAGWLHPLCVEIWHIRADLDREIKKAIDNYQVKLRRLSKKAEGKL